MSLDVERLYDYWPYLCHVVLKTAPTLDHASCEDVASEAMETALRKADRFTDYGGGMLPWLHTIAYRATMDYYRRAARRPERRLEVDDALEEYVIVDLCRATADAGSDQHDTIIDVNVALEHLPEQQRALLTRCYYDDLGIIAAYGAGRPKVMASRRHREALAALRGALVGAERDERGGRE